MVTALTHRDSGDDLIYMDGHTNRKGKQRSVSAPLHCIVTSLIWTPWCHCTLLSTNQQQRVPTYRACMV